MSSKIQELSKNNNIDRSIGVTMNGKSFLKTQNFSGSNLEILEKGFSPLNVKPGNETSLLYTPTNGKFGKVEQLFLRFTIKNNHPTDSMTIYNPFFFLESLKIEINNFEFINYDSIELMLRVHDYLMNHQDKVYSELTDVRTEDSEGTITGEVVPPNSKKEVNLPLFWVVPSLENFLLNHPAIPIHGMKLIVKFRSESSAQGVVGMFCRSSTASNIYFNDNIALESVYMDIFRVTSPDPLINALPHSPIHDLTEYTKAYHPVDFSSTANSFKFKLSDLPQKNLVTGITLFIFDRGAITSFDDPDCCKFYSGPKYIRYKIADTRNGNDDLEVMTDREARIHHNIMIKQRYNTRLVSDLMKQDTDLDKFWLPGLSYIDLTMVDHHSTKVSVCGGINTKKFGADIEIEIFPAQAMSNDCVLHYILHTPEFKKIEANKISRYPYEKMMV